MTDIEKAIKHFKNMRDDAVVVLDSGFGNKKGENNSLYKRRKLYAELAISALEKQIPKKPLNKTSEYNGDYGKCPYCGRTVSDYDNLRVCTGCGQALDWK